MEDIAELVDPGGIAEALTSGLPGLEASPKSFLDDQDDKPNEVLKMVDSDILDLARQVGDEIDENSQSNSATDLSFLENAVAKEADGEEDDPALSFLVGDGKMEVTSADLDFLDDAALSEAGSSDGSEIYEDDSEDDEGSNSSDRDESKAGETEDQDESVFGQVSFYDDDSSSLQEAKGNLPKVTKKVKVKKKRRRKISEDGNEEDEGKPAKKKRKNKKVKDSKKDDEDEDDDDDDCVNPTGASQMRRKNIRSIKSEKDLDKDMLSAQNEELERQKRLMELKKSLIKEKTASVGLAAKALASSSTSSEDSKQDIKPVHIASKASSSVETSCGTDTANLESSSKMVTASAGTSPPKEKDSQLKSLLQVAEEEAEKEAEAKARKQMEVAKIKKETRDTSPPSDVITLSSDSESSDEDDEDSDDVVMVPSDEEDEPCEAEDVNNAGAHIDDSLNLPDEQGRVKVNIGHPSEDPDIFLAPQIAQAIKPHQIGGVRFLYDNVLESLERFRTSPGFGCILAHSMGLGKTIQLISFIDIFIRCAGGKRVLCIVPINTLQNWLAEFNYWLPPPEKLHPDDNLTQSRVFPLYIINDNMKTTAARAAVIEKWKEHGGALLIGYEMFRLLSSKKAAPSKSKSRSKKTEVIDVEEEDKNKSLMIDMHAMLVDPGPDLVMCDEGHRIKNSSAAISQALKTIKTKRRVVLTGYPLQNNLMEYWCMVDFVRPNFLGTKTEFSNMFERPIMNGQCLDSTNSDKKIMRHRSYVLHNLLEGFVQRRGHTVLQVNLPPKLEHVFLVRLSPVQRKIYCGFMDAITESGLCSWANNNPLKAFAVCCKIWNHPDILHEVLTKHIADKDNDLDIDTGEGGNSKKKKKTSQAAKSGGAASSASLTSTDSNLSAISGATPGPTPSMTPSASTTSLTSMASETSSEKNPITYDWAEPLMSDYTAGVMENSGKFVLMNGLIEECLAVGDKVLIFSQSLLTLNKIEEFLGKMQVPLMGFNETWQKNRTYFRLDGSTSAQDREKLINQFNDPCNNVWLFLLSTKAGCLGINLVAANRVIVVDASWNPCHDCQAICRVYRFGQVKSSYVYRFITENTLERRIYDRQINKQGISDRIVDDMNIENKLTRKQVENLLEFEDQEYPDVDFNNAPEKYGKDAVLVNVLRKYGQWLTKQPFTHESLLIDRKELRLSKREKRLAKEGYARDKRMNVSYSRPSYAAYYPQMGGLPNRFPMGSRYNYAAFHRGPVVRPIASVRPMISANSQNGAEKIKQFGGQPLRPGVTIHQVITTTEIVLPGTNTSTTSSGGASNKISAGQKILVIKTPKGVYIRTNDGKMFAVRSKTGGGMGVADTGAAASITTTTTTTLTSSAGNQVFVPPSSGLTGGLGGKKPPIIIVSNKKGVPASMIRGGSIIRTLPYGSANMISALRPSLLKSGVIKGTDSTNTTSSTLTKVISAISTTSTSTEENKTGSGPAKVTTLADLIADVNDSTSGEGKADGGTQSEGGKPGSKPVIVLPSLAVRTPRSVVPNTKSSTVATTSPGGGTVVIMPTKPVVSMGTKRSAKAHRFRKPARGKGNVPEGGGVEVVVGVGGTILSSKSTTGVSANMSGMTVQAGSGTGSDTSPFDDAAAKSSSVATGTTGMMASSSSTAPTSVSVTGSESMPMGTGQMSTGNQMGGIMQSPVQQQQPEQQTPQLQQQQQQQSAFPDLNSMWQNNFGSIPPSGSIDNNVNSINNFNTGNRQHQMMNSSFMGNNHSANNLMMSNNEPQGPPVLPQSGGDPQMNGGFSSQLNGQNASNQPQQYNNPYLARGGPMNQSFGQNSVQQNQYMSQGQQQQQNYNMGSHQPYMGQNFTPGTSNPNQGMMPPNQNQGPIPPSQPGMYGGNEVGGQNRGQSGFGFPMPTPFGNMPTSFGNAGTGSSFSKNNFNTPQQQACPMPQDQNTMSSLLDDPKVAQGFSQTTNNMEPSMGTPSSLPQPTSSSSSNSKSSGLFAPNVPQPTVYGSGGSPSPFPPHQTPPPSSTISHSIGGMLSSPASIPEAGTDINTGTVGNNQNNASTKFIGQDTNNVTSGSNKSSSKNSNNTKSKNQRSGSKSSSSKKNKQTPPSVSSASSSPASLLQNTTSSNNSPHQPSNVNSHHQPHLQQQPQQFGGLNIPSPGIVRQQGHDNSNVSLDVSGVGNRPSSSASTVYNSSNLNSNSGPGISGSVLSSIASNNSANNSIISGNIHNFSGADSSLGSLGAIGGNSNSFGIPLNTSLSSMMGPPSMGTDIGMAGSSAFRAHQGSTAPSCSIGLPPSAAISTANPFGGISSMPGSLGFNSAMGMGAFGGGFGATGGYGAGGSAFGSYPGAGFAPGAFPSSMMTHTPQASAPAMMGYPGHHQTPLGYPSMSSLLPPAPPPASMWQMMAPPSAMMGAGYGYPAPPGGMAFPPTGLDGQGFGSLGHGSSGN